MSSVVISGDTSGSVTLSAPATAGSNTIVLPSGSGTLTLPSGTGTVSVNGVNSNIVAGTAVASTSGTSIDFTSIPSWVKRITVMLQGVSTSGTSGLLLQLGTSSGIENTGYLGAGLNMQNNNSYNSYPYATSGMSLETGTFTSAYARMATIILNNYGSNIWYESHNANVFTTTAMTTTFYTNSGIGTKTVGATLDRIRLTTVGGTDTFDAGSINILYE